MGDMINRLWLAWHVLRGRPLIYNIDFFIKGVPSYTAADTRMDNRITLGGSVTMRPKINTIVKDCTFDGYWMNYRT